MRIKQDLSIALVLAVIGCGLATPGVSRERQNLLEPIEQAMEGDEFTPEEAERVRKLIAAARDLQQGGDEDGSAAAMAEALAILRAV